MFSQVCLLTRGGGTYLSQGGFTLAVGKVYLPWRGIPTLASGGVGTTLAGGLATLTGGYLPWPGVPTLVGATYLGRGYQPWPGGYLPWTGGTYLGWVYLL